MGKLIYLDHFRPKEPNLPLNPLCGNLVAPCVVTPSAPLTYREPRMQNLLLRELAQLAKHDSTLMDAIPPMKSMTVQETLAVLKNLPVETRRRLRTELRSWMDKKFPVNP